LNLMKKIKECIEIEFSELAENFSFISAKALELLMGIDNILMNLNVQRCKLETESGLQWIYRLRGKDPSKFQIAVFKQQKRLKLFRITIKFKNEEIATEVLI
jgi:hypothetical protein